MEDNIICLVETGCVGVVWCAVVYVQQWHSLLSTVAKFMGNISINEGYRSRSWLNLRSLKFFQMVFENFSFFLAVNTAGIHYQDVLFNVV